MTGYNIAHGDTSAVRLDLMNDHGTYLETMRIVRVAWWDDDDNTWNDIDKAASQLRDYVAEIQARADQDLPEFGEIRDADLSGVDFRELITDELEELNIQDGRERTAGL
ncbi:hypothetical protein L3Y21_gp101 [Gordonia phage Rabbitrun]|uniref:Uncharacterized protein n=1 Tax=Gordonia phage Rabbitrun TaxID=2762280 RepID=A0A7G8LIU3_9CAUD|nr:hypothetical protein L3Y21_gp101 [Gordonia phage Rabbitrun]QNJ57165.1 hypothetical protein SEA_RABBITRUN_135 [Gordonia phage Rabbitrun]